MIRKGILKAFDSNTYKASVQVVGSLSVWLDNVSVSTALNSGDMVAGRSVVLLSLDPSNPKDCILIGLWGAPQEPPGYIRESLVDAKGDLLVGTADNTVARKAVGADGKFLKADSSKPDGLDWADAGGGAGETLQATFTNKSGAASEQGYVYRLDPDNNDSFDYGSEDEDAQVVVTPAVINDNASGLAILTGYTDVYVTGDTTRGQYLYFSATNGQAKPSNYRRDGCIGIAAENRVGAGLVAAYIMPKERTRRFYTEDEDNWRRYVSVPFGQWTRVAGGQPCQLSGADFACVQYCIFWHPPDQRYYNIYSNPTISTQVMCASSTDRINWTPENGGLPIFTTAALGAWAAAGIVVGGVVYDYADPVNPWKMALFNVDADRKIGVVQSANLMAGWADAGINPKLTPPAGDDYEYCALVIAGREFYIFFVHWIAVGGVYNIRLAYANNFAGAWTNWGIVIPGAGNVYVYLSAYWNMGVWYVIFTQVIAGTYRIVMATRTGSPAGTFELFHDNPIMALGAGGAWDDNYNMMPCILREKNRFSLWYTGAKADPIVFKLGLAELNCGEP